MVTLIKREVETGPKAEKASGPVNIDDWAGRVSLDIIGQAGFGSEFSSLSYPHTALNTSYRAAFVPNEHSQLIFVLSRLTTPKLVNLLPGKNSALFREGKRSVTDWVRNLIQDRKADMYNHVDDLDYMDKNGQKDIIAAAMKTKAFSTEDLVHQSKTLLGAGHETLGSLRMSSNRLLTSIGLPPRLPGVSTCSLSPDMRIFKTDFATKSEPISQAQHQEWK